jgi:hypothetical protein
MKTMKFITLCASVLLAASAARAQHTVGVFGGFGTGTARFYPAQETKSVGGRFSGGFSWRYYSATRFVGCVGVDLEFLQRGFAYAPFASTTENEADYVYYTRKLNSFVVPLVWQPHFYLARRHLRVYLEAALTFSYNFELRQRRRPRERRRTVARQVRIQDRTRQPLGVRPGGRRGARGVDRALRGERRRTLLFRLFRHPAQSQ